MKEIFQIPQLKIFIILRKDKSPTYQLSATVDDHEMEITHVIRGDDHMINSFKQNKFMTPWDGKFQTSLIFH